MKNLRRLGVAVVLTLILGLSTFAGETSTPPGETNTPPCVPGETSSPPCTSMMAAPGEILTPPAAESFDVLALAETVLSLVF